MNKIKEYKVSFVPFTDMQYDYVVEAKNEDEAFDKAEQELRFAIGYDNAKHNFECSNIEEVSDGYVSS